MSTWTEVVCGECGCVVGHGQDKWELHMAWHKKIGDALLYPPLVLTAEGEVRREQES